MAADVFAELLEQKAPTRRHDLGIIAVFCQTRRES